MLSIFLFLLACTVVSLGHGTDLLPTLDHQSPFNEESFRGLASLADHVPPTALRARNGDPPNSLWESLLVAAAEQDLYATANLALRRMEALRALRPALFSKLACLGARVVESDRLANPRLSYFITNEALSASTDDQLRSLSLPMRVPIDSDLSSACSPSSSLELPSRYDPPGVSVSRRMLPVDEIDPTVHEYAKEIATKRRGPAQWKAVMTEEETTDLKFALSDFVLGVAELPDRTYLIAVYSRGESDCLTQRKFEVTLADENNNQFQVTLSVLPGNRNVGGPSYSVFKSAGRVNALDKHTRKIASEALKLMTYNIWNFNGDWQMRKKAVARFIAEQAPDLVGVQEIRYRYAGGPTQLDELVEELLLLNQSYHFFYQPAMFYSTEAEGVGVLSRFPFLALEYMNLTFVPGSGDSNRRIVLRALVQKGEALFNFFVSHFTYAIGAGQMSNALELYAYMARQPSNIAQAVVADFNVYSGHEEPTSFLTGNLSYSGLRGDLSDVWELAHGSEPGYTFSNLPWSSGLVNRADRILIRNMDRVYAQPNATVTTGKVKPGQNPASDHLAVSSIVLF